MPAPHEIALAYAYCIEARPEVWAFVPLSRRADDIEREVEAIGQMSVYDWQKRNGFDYGLPDFFQYRHIYNAYRTYFKYQYGPSCSISSLGAASSTVNICGSISEIGEAEFLSFYDSYEKRSLLISKQIKEAKEKVKKAGGQ